ncbi:MAG: hypothetical protein HYU37_15185 [Acidobacteria bacterium]|nr:hypothetical protein [Acidobacteriota bacterium]
MTAGRCRSFAAAPFSVAISSSSWSDARATASGFTAREGFYEFEGEVSFDKLLTDAGFPNVAWHPHRDSCPLASSGCETRRA